jgi:hypothetical protein
LLAKPERGSPGASAKIEKITILMATNVTIEIRLRRIRYRPTIAPLHATVEWAGSAALNTFLDAVLDSGASLRTEPSTPSLVVAKKRCSEIRRTPASARPKGTTTPQEQATGSGAILRSMNHDCQGRIIRQIAPGCHIVNFTTASLARSARMPIRSVAMQRRLLATANVSTPADAWAGCAVFAD